MALFAMILELFLKNIALKDSSKKKKRKVKRREKMFLEKPDRNSLGTSHAFHHLLLDSPD